ncbi:MAG: DNA polymerase I PolA [Bacteroidetes bacterium HLUCCA01]|nr:MAG: DNA polymerase I PolA [Bacteroidetes bacterium HLUCCA01]
MHSNTLILLDGTALAYRSYFAMLNSNLRNSEGLPTGTVFGFANALVRLIEARIPTHIAVAWDTHAPTFRHEMDPEYKANRPPQPDEIRASIPIIKEMLGYFNIPSLELDGYEADDLVGSLAESARGQDVQVFMVTPDKDFMQLVHDNICMMKPLSKGDGFEIIDRRGVELFFGVPPEKVIDVLAVIGDSSDNIPGITGIGKKNAPLLIQEFGSLEGLIKAAPAHKSKRVREGIAGNEDRIRLSREMIVIKTDIPDFRDWTKLKWDGADDQKLGVFFQRMQFRTLARKFAALPDEVKTSNEGQTDLFSSIDVQPGNLPDTSVDSYVQERVEYTLVTTVARLRELLPVYEAYNVLCYDTETTGTDPMHAELLGIALSGEPGKAVYVALNAETMDAEAAKALLRPLLTRTDVTYVGHNLKYDYIVLHRAGITPGDTLFDTMIAAYLLDPSQPLKMDTIALKYLNYRPIPIESLIGSGRKQRSIADLPVQDVFTYACEDADITFRLYEILTEQLRTDELEQIARDVEFPLVTVLARMELAGIRIDQAMLATFSDVLAQEMRDVEQHIYEQAGVEFNINSPAQLGDILFNRLKLPSGKKTATGKYSTSEAVLSDLAVTYPLPAKILEYRALAKLRSTYVEALPPMVHPQTGRIHTSYNQNVAATGRLSSSNPNLQNIPIRTERGREIRRAFIPADGCRLVAADYSQIELRVIASMAADEAMMQAFRNDEDIHARTAKEIFGLSSLEEVDRDQRRKAKEVNFGIPYGVSAFGLAQRLGIGNNEGKAIIEAYFDRFPGILRYIDDTKEYARQHGYVKTLLGRRRYIPDINAANFNVRGFAERTAINMPIQGTAADMIKLAMIHMDRLLKDGGYKTRMLLQVHDELVFEVPEQEVDQLVPEIVKTMEKAMVLDVPVKVEAGVASNWLDAH